jgi:hypothetical protein
MPGAPFRSRFAPLDDSDPADDWPASQQIANPADFTPLCRRAVWRSPRGRLQQTTLTVREKVPSNIRRTLEEVPPKDDPSRTAFHEPCQRTRTSNTPEETDESSSERADELSLPESLKSCDTTVTALRELLSDVLCCNVTAVTNEVVNESQLWQKEPTSGKGKERQQSSSSRPAGDGIGSSGGKEGCRGKRVREETGQGGEGDGNGESPGDPGGHSATPYLEEKSISPRFACPFYKENREKYKDWRTCRGPGWKTAHRVK